MEILDLYDKKGNKKGLTAFRGEYIREDDYILVAHVYIYNKNKEFLLQRRSRRKKMNSGKWDVTGGAVKVNETSIDAAIRETFEEIGLELNKDDLRLVSSHVSQKHIIDIYFIETEVNLENLKLQREEVAAVKFFSKEGLLQVLKDHDIKDDIYFNIVKTEVDKI